MFQGSVSGSVQATDRLMKELREIYKSDSYKKGKHEEKSGQSLFKLGQFYFAVPYSRTTLHGQCVHQVSFSLVVSGTRCTRIFEGNGDVATVQSYIIVHVNKGVGCTAVEKYSHQLP